MLPQASLAVHFLVLVGEHPPPPSVSADVNEATPQLSDAVGEEKFAFTFVGLHPSVTALPTPLIVGANTSAVQEIV